MKRIFATAFSVVIFAGLFSSCGGGSSDSSSLSLADLEGTWLGPYAVVADSISLVFDESGQITDLLTDGSSAGYTGTVVQIDDNHFHLDVQALLSGGLFVDGPAEHSLLYFDSGPIVLLEKGATVIPTYADDDVVGSWSGFGYAYSDTLGEMVKVSPVTATITDNVVVFALSGSFAGEPIMGAVGSGNPSIGAYQMDFSLDGLIYTGAAFLSPDKNCIGIMAYTGSPSTYPDDYHFILLTRN